MPPPFGIHGRALFSLLLAASAATAQDSARPSPVLVTNAQYDVVMVTSAAARALGDAEAMSRYLAACGARIPIPDADSIAVMGGRPWEWESDAARAAGRVTLLVSRTIPAEVDCDSSPADRMEAFGRGLRVTTDTAERSSRRLLSVRIRRGTREIEPLERSAILSTSISRRGLHTEGGGMIRLTLPLDALVPDSTGRVDDLRIEIVGADSVYVHTMRMPWEPVRELWTQVIGERSEPLGDPVAGIARRFEMWRIGSGPPYPAYADWAELGAALAEAGDQPLSRVAFNVALELEPCLTFAPSMTAPARIGLEATARPPARCSANVARAALRGALLPGFGHVNGPSRTATSFVVLGFVAGTLVLSQAMNDEARALYTDYLQVANTDARKAYDAAESKRVTGSVLVASAVTVWVASLAEGVWRERQRSQRLARVRGFAPAAREVGLEPRVLPRGVGLALTIR